MGSGMTKAGIILLSAGLLVAASFSIIGLVFSASDSKEEVLNENDFSSSYDYTYTARVYNDDIGTEFSVSIISRNPYESIRFELTLEDDWLNEEYSTYGYRSTPFEEDITVDTFLTGYWEFTITFEGTETSIDDVDISVKANTNSGSESMLCCGLIFLLVIGILMAITGLILLIVGLSTGNKNEKGPYTGQQQYPGMAQQGTPHAPGQSPPGPPPAYGHQAPRQQPNRGIPPQPVVSQGVPPQERAPVSVSRYDTGTVPPDERARILRIAREHEKAGDHAEATRIYEQMELFDDAERCIRSERGLPPKESDPAIVLRRIREIGAPVSYNCPFCRTSIFIDGSKLGKRFCDRCGNPIDFDVLANR
ncbi:MAG: hypothetical protein R6V01_09990 [Thermoplasmatota archaeon]